MEKAGCQYNLDEVRARYKEFQALLKEQRESANDIIAQAFPFSGRGVFRRGKKAATATTPVASESSDKSKGRSGPRECAVCGKPQKGHPRVNRRLHPCKFSKEEIEAIGEEEDETEMERALDESYGQQLLSLFPKSYLEDSDESDVDPPDSP